MSTSIDSPSRTWGNFATCSAAPRLRQKFNGLRTGRTRFGFTDCRNRLPTRFGNGCTNAKRGFVMNKRTVADARRRADLTQGEVAHALGQDRVWVSLVD